MTDRPGQPLGLARPLIHQMLQSFQPEDLLDYSAIEDLASEDASPAFAFTVRAPDRAADSYSSSVWVQPLGGGEPRRFTTGGVLDRLPQWSPDGKSLSFLSDRGGGQAQINLIEFDGGEARQLGQVEFSIISYGWSPDGNGLYFTASVPVDPDTLVTGGDSERAQDAPRPIDRLPYKLDGTGYTLDREQHLFLMDRRTGDTRQVTSGHTDVRSASFSPDGRWVACTRTREGRETHCTSLWRIEADGDAELLSDELDMFIAPTVSPDGTRIVCMGSRIDGDARVGLWLYDLASSTLQLLGDEHLEAVIGGSLRWEADSASVICILAREGRQHICRVSVPDGVVTPIVQGDRQVLAFARSGNHLAFVSEDGISPGELHLCDIDGGDERVVTRHNDWWSARPRLVRRAMQFEVPDGNGGTESVHGWLFEREGAPAEPAPLLVDVHGGPASYTLIDFASRPWWQMLCCDGWRVLALNPVGSSSFGREFADRSRGRWGEIDLPQFLAAVGQLRSMGLADARVGISGKSYGGFVCAWAIGHTTEFRVAIVSAPILDMRMHHGTSDSGYYSDTYSMKGAPYELPELYGRLSPLEAVPGSRVPTLILQGDADERCPMCQSESLFVTLIRTATPHVQMVLYPGGSHHFFESGKPSHRVDAARRTVAWLKRFIEVPLET